MSRWTYVSIPFNTRTWLLGEAEVVKMLDIERKGWLWNLSWVTSGHLGCHDFELSAGFNNETFKGTFASGGEGFVGYSEMMNHSLQSRENLLLPFIFVLKLCQIVC